MESIPLHQHVACTTEESLPDTPFAWGVGRRLGVVAVLIAVLWLAVVWALGGLGGVG
ncbi:MAG: hypothetical protein H7836_02645 [Magnetococcus sp. YQC-3]